MNENLFDFISACVTPCHAVAHISALLREEGYLPLPESTCWEIQPGGKYYVTRNGSSLIAFRVPRFDFTGFTIAAAHDDSPCLRIKENEEVTSAGCVRLSAEIYGGMLRSTWADRPLSVAGRVLIQAEGGIETRLVDFRDPVLVIPNVAIHLNRKANESAVWNPAVDLLPLWSTTARAGSFRAKVAELAGTTPENILSTELYAYNPQQGVCWNDLISAPRLDDLQCVFSLLKGFLQAKESSAVPVCAVFNNEEVGSGTKQGACSTLLPDVLTRLNAACGRTPEDYLRAVAGSFLASCDNAHAMHPAHPELSDPNHAPKLNGGVVIKMNANQKYTTDGISAGIFRAICRRAGVPLQDYANRADLPGGSTLGNLLNAQVSLNGVDIGIAQLAMHSAMETAGAEDTAHMTRAMQAYFGTAIIPEEDGNYRI